MEMASLDLLRFVRVLDAVGGVVVRDDLPRPGPLKNAGSGVGDIHHEW